MRYVCCWLSFWLFFSDTFGQSDSLSRKHQFYAEASTIITSSGTVPFWQRANQFATVPLTGSVGTLRLGTVSDYRPQYQSTGQKRHIDWGYGLEAVFNAGPFGQQVILPDAYLKGRWRWLEGYVGRRREIVGLVDTTLTSGAYAISGNALPIPVIQFNTRGFVPIPFTKGIISTNLQFANGWFWGSGPSLVWHRMFNRSALYFKLGKPTWPVRFSGGLSHQVVWGGYSPYLSNEVSEDGRLPSDIRAWFYAATGLAYPTSGFNVGLSSIDELNRIGNHLGSLDMAAEFEVGNTTVMVYRQNPYDTGALWWLTTLRDGLNGVSIRRRQPGTSFISVDRGLVEFLYTQSQGGNVFVLGTGKLQGRVDYFNNEQQIDGWTYQGRTIGTPFLTPAAEVRPGLPTRSVANNRVGMLHLALTGRIGKEATWLLKLSSSNNLGTYRAPFPEGTTQLSGLIQVASPVQLPVLGEVRLQGSVAVDRGKLLPSAAGFFVGIRKNWGATSAAPQSSTYIRLNTNPRKF